MSKDKLRLFKTPKLSTVWFIGVALIILFGIILLSNVDKLNAIFNGNKFGDGGEHVGGDGLPIMSEDELSGGDEIYYDSNTADLFASINVRDSYRREFRITNSYDDVNTTDTFTMLKSGSNYSVKSTSKNIIYSGGKLYIESGLYSLVTDATETEVYEDIGITPLERVIEIANSDNAEVTVSPDGKRITVSYSASEFSSRSEYEISVENGIVTYEAHYKSGQLTRTVTTDYVDVLVGEDISEEHFVIPTLQ